MSNAVSIGRVSLVFFTGLETSRRFSFSTHRSSHTTDCPVFLFLDPSPILPQIFRISRPDLVLRPLALSRNSTSVALQYCTPCFLTLENHAMPSFVLPLLLSAFHWIANIETDQKSSPLSARSLLPSNPSSRKPPETSVFLFADASLRPQPSVI